LTKCKTQKICYSLNRIDRNGDSQGNFTTFALKEFNYTFVSRFSNKKFSCPFYLTKVGEFQAAMEPENRYPTYTIQPLV
jgi:hypothetical protein